MKLARIGKCAPLGASVALAAALLSAPAGWARPQNAPRGNAATGKTLYSTKMCSQCHGAAAQGTDAAPAIAGYALSLADLTHQVRTPANKMPAFAAESVSDAQLADIYAFLRSAAPPASSAAASSAAQAAPAAAAVNVAALGAGNGQNGARIFVAYGCYECHGRAAQGASTGPRLGPNPISVEAMIHELRHPNEMPPFTERVVSDAEINDIHAFLMTLPQPPNPDSIVLLSR